MTKVNLIEKFSQIDEYWKPYVVSEFNSQEVRLAKFRGSFIWHSHESEDEAFLCLSGKVRIELRNEVIELGPGDMFVVPKGIEHRTSADQEAHVVVFEPVATRNTGNIEDPTFTKQKCRI